MNKCVFFCKLMCKQYNKMLFEQIPTDFKNKMDSYFKKLSRKR